MLYLESKMLQKNQMDYPLLFSVTSAICNELLLFQVYIELSPFPLICICTTLELKNFCQESLEKVLMLESWKSYESFNIGAENILTKNV